MDHAALPGHELVAAGVRDLDAGVESVEALLVAVARERLLAAGVAVPPAPSGRPAHRLYDLLAAEHGDLAHGRYGALLRRLASFAHAAEHAAAR